MSSSVSLIRQLPLGERVRIARLSLGVTQAELAERVGLTQARIAQLEAGELRDLDVARLLLNAIVAGRAPEAVPA